MTSQRIIRSPEDDITPGYGLHVNSKPEIFFLSKEWKIDVSRLKSIWGLMLRIYTLESPARRGRVTHMVVAESPEPSLKTMGQRWA